MARVEFTLLDKTIDFNILIPVKILPQDTTATTREQKIILSTLITSPYIDSTLNKPYYKISQIKKIVRKY